MHELLDLHEIFTIMIWWLWKPCMGNLNYDLNGLEFNGFAYIYSILMILNSMHMYLCSTLISHDMIMHVLIFQWDDEYEY